MARVRDVVIPAYVEVGGPGKFALRLMREDLDRAAEAMVSGDVVAMLRVYHALTEWKL
jgi:hypothetical protein